MRLPTLIEFTENSKNNGYDGVTVREWEANTFSQAHTHEFGVHAVIAAGEMWLTRDGITQHLQVGDTFTMDPNTSHSEKYGSNGTVYWAARKFPKK